MYEDNTPHITTPVAEAGREVSERRAGTISRMVDEAAKHGLDDQFAYDAVYDYGLENAHEFRKTMKDPKSFKEFTSLFGTGIGKQIYEMERVVDNDNELEINFHYCPYVTKWVKQGKTPEQISRLCEIAMAGDHAFATQFPQLEFSLDGTIADGDHRCILRFTRKKSQPQER